MDVKISVIIPVYNVEAYLDECLKSVTSQTLKEIEIICVNNGSTDRSGEILDSWAKTDDRIKVITQENSGAAAARNVGIKEANGEYVLFFDADDFVEFNSLEICYKEAKIKDFEIVVFGMRSFPESIAWINKIINNTEYHNNSFNALLYENGSIPFVPNKLYKTRLLKDNNIYFKENFALGEDQIFAFEAFLKAKHIKFISNILYNYRQSSMSAMAKYNSDLNLKFSEHFRIVKEVYSIFETNGYLKENSKYFCEWVLRFMANDLKKCHYNFRIDASKQIYDMIYNFDSLNKVSKENRNKFDLLKQDALTEITPLVSIIMPVFNAEKYLKETLSCIEAQSFLDYEIIFVDDGSTDNTYALLEEFSQNDSRVVLLHQENKGAGEARNNAMKIAKGKYFLFLDSDDFFKPNMLQRAVESIKDADIFIFKANAINHISKQYSNMDWTCRPEKNAVMKKPFNINDCPKDIFHFTTPAPWNKFFRADFIKKHDLTFQNTRSANDMAFIMSALTLADNIIATDEILLSYRVGNFNSLQGSQDKKIDAFYEALLELQNRLKNYGTYKIAKPAFINFALDFCFYNLHTIKLEENFDFILNLIKDEAIFELDIYNKPKDYFYAYLGNKNWEKLQDILSGMNSSNYAKKYGLKLIKKRKKLDSIPKVSIIIPCYNTAVYLNECMQSVVNQTLEEIEIICVDDGSTDETGAMLDEWAKSDGRITVIHKENGGYGKAMNIGLEAATGEYIGIVEPDDYISLDMYETLYGKAEENSVDFIKSDFYRFKGSGSNLIKDYNKLSKNDSLYNRVINIQEDLTPFSFIMNTWCGIYRRDYIEKFKMRHNETPGASFQDNGFWFQTFIHSTRAYFYNKPFYMNRRDNENSSVKSTGKVYAMKYEYDYIYDLLQKETHLYNKFIGVYWLKKYQNYMFTYNRIGIEFKEEFLEHFTAEFKGGVEKKEIDLNLFNPTEKNTLKLIINNPKQFYQNSIVKQKANYETSIARIDFRNIGSAANDIRIIDAFPQVNVSTASWIKDNKGKGYYIENDDGILRLNLLCVKNGTLELVLRGICKRDKNGKNIPVKVRYKKLVINDRIVFKGEKVLWHDDFFKINKRVKDGEIVSVEVEWESDKTSVTNYRLPQNLTFFEKLFSITNDADDRYKAVRLFGLKFRVKRHKNWAKFTEGRFSGFKKFFGAKDDIFDENRRVVRFFGLKFKRKKSLKSLMIREFDNIKVEFSNNKTLLHQTRMEVAKLTNELKSVKERSERTERGVNEIRTNLKREVAKVESLQKQNQNLLGKFSALKTGLSLKAKLEFDKKNNKEQI